MSQFGNLVSKPVTIQIENNDYELKPLSVRDIDLFIDMADDKKRAEAIKQIVLKTLKRSGATEDEITEIGINPERLKAITEGVLKAHGMGDTDQKKDGVSKKAG